MLESSISFIYTSQGSWETPKISFTLPAGSEEPVEDMDGVLTYIANPGGLTHLTPTENFTITPSEWTEIPADGINPHGGWTTSKILYFTTPSSPWVGGYTLDAVISTTSDQDSLDGYSEVIPDKGVYWASLTPELQVSKYYGDPNPGHFGESLENRFILRLSKSIGIDVTFDINVPEGITSDVSSVTFTPSNWSSTQTVTLTREEDPLIYAGNAPVSISIVGQGKASGLSESISGSYTSATGMIDLETSQVTFSDAEIEIKSIGVRLSAEPSSDRSVTASLGSSSQFSLETSSVSFTSDDYNQYKYITLSNSDDPVIDPENEILSLSSSGYSGATVELINENHEESYIDGLNSKVVSAGGVITVPEGKKWIVVRTSGSFDYKPGGYVDRATSYGLYVSNTNDDLPVYLTEGSIVFLASTYSASSPASYGLNITFIQENI